MSQNTSERNPARHELLALLLLIPSACAQAPPIRTQVNEVLVPVVVTNGRGHHITGLKATDFQVFEDGRPERIVAFSTEQGSIQIPASGEISGASNPSAGASKGAADSAQPRQTYLIVVDTLHSASANFGRVRGVLAKFFEKEHGADAQYALIALGREPRIVQDSTREASMLVSAIRAPAFSKMILDSEAANLAAAAEQFTELMREYCSSCQCVSAGTSSDDQYCPDRKSRVQAFLTSAGERTRLLNEQFLGELAQIVDAIASMPTSRTVIFISDGFNRFPGRELYAIMMGYGPKDRSFEFNRRDTQAQLDAVLKIATANNVKFYTIDSRGLYTMAAVPGSGFDASSSSAIHTQMDSRAAPNLAVGVPEAVTLQASSAAKESTDALAELARETGGVFFENSNDLMRGIQQAVADGREYYLLAYVPDNDAMDGKYRKISVTLRDPKWQVHAKPGYWARGGQ